MMMDDSGTGVLLAGGGGHCLSVLDVLATAGICVAGIVQGAAGGPASVAGHPVLGTDMDWPELRRRWSRALVTVGHMHDPTVRMRLFAMLDALGFDLPSVVSPLAHVAESARVGRGSVVMHRALVNADAETGCNTIVNTGAIVEHGCRIGDHCHVAVGAIICGDVHIGTGSFVGAGAVLRQGLRIGERCFIGMGERVIRDMADGEVRKTGA